MFYFFKIGLRYVAYVHEVLNISADKWLPQPLETFRKKHLVTLAIKMAASMRHLYRHMTIKVTRPAQ